MAQNFFMINGIIIKAPEKKGYGLSAATTSTQDSDRTQDLVMHNTPMGTIYSIALKFSNLTAYQVSTILEQIEDKAKYQFHYYNPRKKRWEDGEFYTSNYSVSASSLVDGKEMFDSLSFNAIGVNPA